MKSLQEKNSLYKRLLIGLIAVLLLLLPPCIKSAKEGGRYAVTASAAYVDVLEIQRCDVEMTVLPSRKIEVEERITVKFLTSGTSMFFRSLPKEGAIYSDITASCVGNPDFYFDVIDNPKDDGFIDIECIGGVTRGAVWAYDISYTMQQSVPSKDGMQIDVVGFGTQVPIHNVTAVVHFPAAVERADVYVGYHEQPQTAGVTLSADKKTMTVTRDVLPLAYNDYYGEIVAEGITVDFTLPAGTLASYGKTRFATENIWKLALGALGCIGVAIAFVVTRKKREIIPVVNVKPPEGMSPLQMGKIVDGNVDNEDVTSMIYYFADKGYLKINFEDEEDPELIRLVPALPESAPAHEKTLFKGLFKESRENSGAAKISQLVEDFYSSSEAAKKQVLAPKPMYRRGSVWGMILGGLLGAIYAFIGAFLMGRRIGGGYVYVVGGIFLLPVVVTLLLGAVRENYRYKWKPIKRFWLLLIELAVSALVSMLFIFALGEHLMTGWEKLVICLGGALPALIAQNALARTEKYVQTLGELLGFKDFITVTEEDKIKVMLEENPELYYEILPYAQVLGVTDEWEKKFEKITLPPPSWYSGRDMTFFDYMIINRCINRSIMRGFAEAAMKAGKGVSVGRSGGGGHFGGFGGGGFGGGGFGAR